MNTLTRNVTITHGVAKFSWLAVHVVTSLAWSASSCAATGDAFFDFPAARNDQFVVSPSKEPETVTLSVRRAARLYQEKRYDEAVSSIESALVEMPDLPANAELRTKLLSMLRLAKAKSLVANYRERLDQLEEESNRRKVIKGLVITQAYGTVLQSVEGKRSEVSVGGNVSVQVTFFVRAESGLEMTSEDGGMIRSVDTSAFSFTGQRAIRLNEGSILLHLPKNALPFHVDGPLAGVKLSTEKASTVLVSVTTSGGLKIIANERNLMVASRDQELKLRPGELVFALPEPQALSRKMDVELSTILMTADLLTGFEEPVPFSRSLRLAAAMQARRIIGRFRAVVGDVESEGNFQVKVIEDEEPEDETKKDEETIKKGGISRFFRGFGSGSKGK